MSADSDPTVELLKVLPELAAASYRAAPHGHPRTSPSDRAPLTHRQMEVVLHLAANGRQTMTELADGLGVGRAAATEMVERLVVKGLVRREASPTDRRVMIVELTDDAQAQADATVERWRGPLNAVFARFPHIEPATLIGFLAALAGELKGLATDV